MEFILLSIIVLQFFYSAYKDSLYAKEREKLRVMIKSKDALEYSYVSEKEEEPEEQKEENPYIPIEDVSIERIVKAKEIL